MARNALSRVEHMRQPHTHNVCRWHKRLLHVQCLQREEHRIALLYAVSTSLSGASGADAVLYGVKVIHPVNVEAL